MQTSLTADMRGLSEDEAGRRLLKQGPNELPMGKAKGVVSILLGVIREPMVGLLVACSVLYLMMGETSEGIPLFLSVFLVIGISLFQEWRAERALDALRELASPRALVVRGGRERRIPGREVVPGDLLIVHEGDRIAADARVVECSHLRVDESMLTGESLPVRKGDDTTVYSGTLVVGGRGQAEVMATGVTTELGKIGKSLEDASPDASRVAQEVSRIVRHFGVLGIATSILIAVGYGLTRGDWPHGLLAGLSAAMSLLPEEFPLVLTIFFSMGAWRLSRVRVLTRQGRAIETLGAITVLCVDKTGTLTRNRMTVRELRTLEEVWRAQSEALGPASALPESVHPLLEFGALASHVDTFDPIDRAVLESLDLRLAGTEHIHRDWELLREYPLSDELLAMSCVWKSRGTSRRLVVASKGAPEAIVDLCHLDAATSERARALVSSMSEGGLRVLGVARAFFDEASLPGHPHEFAFELVGFIGFEDPVREQVPAAIGECRRAGIRVVMITGDHPKTAIAIARQAGFAHPERILTGQELEGLDEKDLASRLRDIEVFARVVPHQKLRIIQGLKANHEVVAMTGDGVNDAPALKWADVGISMGERGTDVAREASDLVLLDDDFTSIVAGIRMGRRVYDNLVSAMSYIVAVHVPIATLAVIPVLFGLPLILFPAHIVFLELIVDPASTLVFEAEDAGAVLMKRKPRDPAEVLFNRSMLLRTTLEGVIAAAACVCAMWVSRLAGWSEELGRSVAFSTLVLGNLALILASRAATVGANKRAWFLIAGALVLLPLIQVIPALRRAFQISPLGLGQWAFVSALGTVTLVLSGVVRRFRPKEGMGAAGV
jgi:Ca2+-transporting ATPase